jgi:uncharacterized protein (DUF1778 family)
MAKKRAQSTKPKPKTEVTLSIRLTKEQRDLVAKAAEVLGWSPTRLIRTATLERAVHVLNIRLASETFDALAQRVATQLFDELNFMWTLPGDLGDLVKTYAGPDLDDLCRIASESEPPEVARKIVPDRPVCFDLESYRNLVEVTRLGGTEFWQLVLEAGRRRFTHELGEAQPGPIDPDQVTR